MVCLVCLVTIVHFVTLICRDFNAPLVPPRPADSSAATIASAGLLFLANMEKSLTPPNNTGYDIWTNHAIQVRQFSPTASDIADSHLLPRSWMTQLRSPGNLNGRASCQMALWITLRRHQIIWLVLSMVRFILCFIRLSLTDHGITGDYYYVKAGNDLINMGLAKCPSS